MIKISIKKRGLYRWRSYNLSDDWGYETVIFVCLHDQNKSGFFGGPAFS